MGRRLKGYLYKRGKIWWVRWRVGTAVYCQSTGETARKEAEKARDRMIEPWKLKDRALREAALVARVVESRAVMESLETLKAGRMELNEVTAQEQSSRGGTLAARSAEGRRAEWRMFLEWLREHYPRAKTVGDLRPSMGEEYAAELGGKLSRARVRARLGAVRSVLAGVGAAGGWERVGSGVGRETDAGTRRAFTKEEVARLLATADGEDKWLLTTLYWTGLRLGDAATLRVSDRRREGGKRVLVVRTAKGGKVVRLVESPELSVALDEAERAATATGTAWLFPAAAELAGGKRRPVLSTRLNAFIGKTLGVERVRRGDGGRGQSVVSVHSFRHTLATLCAEAGVPIEDVRAWLGHSSAVVTEIYTHRDEGKTGAKINAALSLP